MNPESEFSLSPLLDWDGRLVPEHLWFLTLLICWRWPLLSELHSWCQWQPQHNGVFSYRIVTWFACGYYFKICYLSMLGVYWYYSFNSNIGYSRHCLKAYFFAFLKERFGLGKRIRKSNPSFPFSNLSVFQPQISTWKGFNNFKLDFGMSDDSNSLCTQITTEELIIVSGLCDALM